MKHKLLILAAVCILSACGGETKKDDQSGVPEIDSVGTTADTTSGSSAGTPDSAKTTGH